MAEEKLQLAWIMYEDEFGNPLPMETDPNKKKKWWKWLKEIGLIGVFGIVIGFFGGGSSGMPGGFRVKTIRIVNLSNQYKIQN